jgi:hypothetical protein
MSYVVRGYGKDTDVVGSAAAYGFGVKILIPFFQKLRTYLVRITRMRVEEVQK